MEMRRLHLPFHLTEWNILQLVAQQGENEARERKEKHKKHKRKKIEVNVEKIGMLDNLRAKTCA